MTMRMPDPSYVEVNGDAVAWYSIGNGPETLVGSPGMFTAVESMVESPGPHPMPSGARGSLGGRTEPRVAWWSSPAQISRWYPLPLGSERLLS